MRFRLEGEGDVFLLSPNSLAEPGRSTSLINESTTLWLAMPEGPGRPGQAETVYAGSLDESGNFSGWSEPYTAVWPLAGCSCESAAGGSAGLSLLLLPLLGRRRRRDRRAPCPAPGPALGRSSPSFRRPSTLCVAAIVALSTLLPAPPAQARPGDFVDSWQLELAEDALDGARGSAIAGLISVAACAPTVLGFGFRTPMLLPICLTATIPVWVASLSFLNLRQLAGSGVPLGSTSPGIGGSAGLGGGMIAAGFAVFVGGLFAWANPVLLTMAVGLWTGGISALVSAGVAAGLVADYRAGTRTLGPRLVLMPTPFGVVGRF